jgi:hypothetical protein
MRRAWYRFSTIIRIEFVGLQKKIEMSQLTGYVATKKANTTGFLLVLALVCAAAFVVFKYAHLESKIGLRAVGRPAASFTVSDDMEALTLPLDRAAIAEADAEAALYKSQLWMDRTARALEYDPVAARRLQVARAAQASAASEILRVREELEIAKGILNERRDKQ